MGEITLCTVQYTESLYINRREKTAMLPLSYPDTTGLPRNTVHTTMHVSDVGICVLQGLDCRP
jgi:hypothetical protein